MRNAILLLATFSAAGAGIGLSARLHQPNEPSRSLVVAAVCEVARADANRFGAATLDILPCGPQMRPEVRAKVI